MKTLYTAEALATGEGRDGHGRTSDGTLDLDLAIPKEMGGSGNGTNPEQLFAVGYAACFHSALRLVGRQARRLAPEPLRYVGGKVVRWGTLASEEAAAAGRTPPAAARAAAAIPRLLRMPIGTR